MIYRLKKDVHIRRHSNMGYIINMQTHADRAVNDAGAVFLFALSEKPQTIDVLADKILSVFVGVDKPTIITDAAEFYDTLVREGFLVKGETEEELNSRDAAMCYEWNTTEPHNRDTLNFYLPGFDLQMLDFYRSMVSYMQEFPYRFMENVKIPALYGSFNNMIWNGGRIRIGRMATYDEMAKAIENVNNSGMAVRYTYTNSALEERHLLDTVCNLSMDLAHNGKNEVLVNSPILEKYLREHYPNFKYILSTTACERDVGKINEATKKYDLVVIDYRDNKNISFLEKIEDKDKIEILIDEKCPIGCQSRKLDYEAASKKICYQCSNSEDPDFECLRDKSDVTGFYRGLRNNPYTNLSFNELYGLYYDMGFRHFKFLGRNEKDYLTEIESYIYYLSAPDSRDVVRYDLLGIYMDYIIEAYGGNRKDALKWYAERLTTNKVK